MKRWPIKRIGEIADVSRGSSPRPIADPRYFDGGTIPWVKIADATKSGKFLYETKEHVNEFGASFSRRLPPGTVLVAASGVTLGYVQILGVEGCAHDGWLILQNLRDLDRDYLYYFLKTINQHFFNASSGAAIQNINTDILRDTPIPHPPLSVQHRIAAILSAYDDLIENNTRRIQILEEMAQMLYREWFVNFRFPGHERVKMVDSEMGRIPEGWSVKTFGDTTINFDSKRIPLSSMKRSEMQGQYPYYGAAKVLDHINNFIFDGKYLLIAEDGSVITPDRKPVLQLAYGKFWVNNHTHVIQGKKPVSTEMLYLALSQVDITGYITGAAQPKITQQNLNRIPIVVAPTEVLKAFNAVAVDLLSQCETLNRKNSILRATRDLLLPKLIAGEVDVAGMEMDLGGTL